MAHVELAEPAQFPPDVVQVEHPRLVDPQADVCCQPGDRVVARGRAELAASSRWLVSLRMVLSASPAEARASTNPDSTSVSKSGSSSPFVGTRCSRRSRTAARANSHPSTSPRLKTFYLWMRSCHRG